MHDDTRRSRHQRARAIDRLRTLTVGTTLAGVAATAGFGGLAAVTYHGFDDQSVDSGSTSVDGSQDGTTTATLPPVSNDATGQNNGATNGAAPRIAAAPTPAPTPRKTHHAHVSSGGSGG